VFYLTSGAYAQKETFGDVSVIVTDTQATADLYKERLGLHCAPVGKFIAPALCKAPQRKPEFITFINPGFEKGVSVFMALARLAALESPELKFLVVESRGRWADALQVLRYEPRDFPNVRVIGHQKDMRSVYAATRALLVPSLWHESGARVVVEALMNAIPVVASRSGGSAELAGTAGTILDLPVQVTREHRTRVPDEVVRPWLKEVQRIWHDPVHYSELVANAGNEADRHDLQRSTDRFLAALRPAMAETRASHASHATATHTTTRGYL
jgi:glycosyltransferase involved in cell wall biosynthesis